MSTQAANKDARTRLLEVGAAQFAEKGYKGASVRNICELAGTGNNMIHHYFGSKRGLYEAIITQFSAEVFSVPIRIMKKMPESRAEFVSRFELFVEETLEALINNRFLFAILQSEEVVPEQSPFVSYYESFIAFVNHGKKNGLVNEAIDPAMLTGLVMDRLGIQVQYANRIKQTTGDDIISDPQYKARWLRANLDMFLYGFLPSN